MMSRSNVKNIERAQHYASLIRNGDNDPVDVGDSIDMRLPDYCDHERVKRAQRLFRSNFYSVMFAMYTGLLAILAIPTILRVLVHTKKSSTDLTAYKRYMQTIYHTLSWFRHDLKPDTKAWNSLEAVRKFHFSASRSAKNANVGMVSQKDMALTQYGFLGFIVLSQKEIGFQASQSEMEDFCHLWRVLGSIVGIKDEYNLCCESFEETLERLEVVKNEFLLPNLTNPPEDFIPMTKYIVNGLTCFNPFDPYDEIIFMTKRMIGVPDFYYFDNEFPDGYDRKHLALYKETRMTRISIWLSVMCRQILLKCFILRWIFNIVTYFSEFLIRYFPFIAFFKFGFGNAYVNI